MVFRLFSSSAVVKEGELGNSPFGKFHRETTQDSVDNVLNGYYF
jgi:hypothetical protein